MITEKQGDGYHSVQDTISERDDRGILLERDVLHVMCEFYVFFIL